MRLPDTLGKRKQAKKHRIVSIATAGICLLLPVSFSAQQTPQQEQPAQTAAKQSVEEERLNILKADIKKEVVKYERLKKELDEMKKLIEQKKDEKSKDSFMKAVKIFESAPAEESARNLEKLDDETAAAILSAMKPRTAGKLFGNMDSDRAVAISKKIIKSKN